MSDSTEPEHPRPAAAAPAADDGFPRRRSRALVLILVIAVAVVLADQLTKLWATSSLNEGEYHSLIGTMIGLQLTYNSGAAFSFLVNATWVFTILAALAAVALLWFSRRLGSRSWAVAFGLLLGGAVTHLGDRLFRAPSFGQGHVVDFIAYANWFIGNVADIAIFFGALLALVLAVAGVPLRGGPRHTHDSA
ncbi:signal peptidase II [Leifsonia sp. McL0607]|uniref:signal peptidase II n=1 Tax=Leifsonia sp. McL0607 TaxID=3415672 RepID=UPI003CF69E41